MSPNSSAGAVPALGAMLTRLALDIVEAQAAMDTRAEAQAVEVSENGGPLPPIAFYFPEVEINLALAFTVTQNAKGASLAVLPVNPTLGGFFQSTSFSSRLRAVIAPRALLAPDAKE